MTECIENELSNLLLPPEQYDKEFWKKNWPALESLGVLLAILIKRKFEFKKSGFKRNDAILLVVIANMAWQSVRELAGVNGRDLDWLYNVIPDGCADSGLYDDHFQVLENMKLVFDMNSVFRHPKAEKFKEYPFIFHANWPENQAQKLISAVDSIKSILNVFHQEFSEHSGWADDIEKKKRLAEYARSN